MGRLLAARRGQGEVRVRGGEGGPGASSWRCPGVSGRLVSHRITYDDMSHTVEMIHVRWWAGSGAWRCLAVGESSHYK